MSEQRQLLLSFAARGPLGQSALLSRPRRAPKSRDWLRALPHVDPKKGRNEVPRTRASASSCLPSHRLWHPQRRIRAVHELHCRIGEHRVADILEVVNHIFAGGEREMFASPPRDRFGPVRAHYDSASAAGHRSAPSKNTRADAGGTGAARPAANSATRPAPELSRKATREPTQGLNRFASSSWRKAGVTLPSRLCRAWTSRVSPYFGVKKG
jgi:hypothetical protein